jgi:F-type H+-transporting ATPase subunit gamma
LATLRIIKRRINSIRGTQQITNAMNMVAAAKLRRAQENIIKARPYAYKMINVLNDISAIANRKIHPLLEQREIKKICFVVVGGDRGLCGGFNNNVFRRAENIYKQHSNLDRSIIVVGKKARDFFRIRKYPMIFEYVNFYRTLKFSDAQQIVGQIIKLYLEKNLDRVDVVYNEFKSAIRQEVILEQLLPFVPKEEESKTQVDYLYEPSADKIMDTLLPLHLNVQMWRILLESNAAEQAARMTAMEAATDNAQEMIENLTLLYNKTRQYAITKELSEIVGGAEALK